MKIEIDWGKIVTQAVTTLIVGVFMGACVIVWKGATSVDDKVKATEARLEFVIKQLSDKLATYEVRFNDVTNQLTKIVEQTAPLQSSLANLLATPRRWRTNDIPYGAQLPNVEQKALSREIYDQLNSKK